MTTQKRSVRENKPHLIKRISDPESLDSRLLSRGTYLQTFALAPASILVTGKADAITPACRESATFFCASPGGTTARRAAGGAGVEAVASMGVHVSRQVAGL